MITFAYDVLRIVKKKTLWEGLQEIAASVQCHQLILGDFNVTLSLQNKQGGAIITNYHVSGFQDFVIRPGMEDLHHSECCCTWTNGRIFCKLDRIMVNKGWLEQNDKWITEFQTPGSLSDHTPSLVSLLQMERPRKKPFKFSNKWTTHECFNALVSNGWQKTEAATPNGTGQYKLKLKLNFMDAEFRQQLTFSAYQRKSCSGTKAT